MSEFGIKELYDVVLKTTYSMEVGGRKVDAGETVAAFDKIQIANFQENKKFFSANGCADGRALVWWEETKEINLSFSQGVFSVTQLAFMSNANLLYDDGRAVVNINRRRVLETDEKGKFTVEHPILEPCFLYKQKTGERVYDFVINNNAIYTNEAFEEYLIDYYYKYDNGYSILSIGNPLTNGYLSLEGKTRVKDDITGQVKTGIIKIPKLKLLSNLSLRLGNDAIPRVGRIDAVAVPTGAKGQKQVMEIIFLNDDIDSDM